MKGTVKWFNKEKGFGFITGEDGKDVLFIYDSDSADTYNLDIIIKILSKNAKVMKIDAGMDYVLKYCS